MKSWPAMDINTPRPFDFRFWHTERQAMYPVEFFTADEIHRSIFDDDYQTSEEFYAIADHPFKHDEGVLMQFTGLTDKEGNQIWEGDILLHEVPCEWRSHEELSINFFTAVVFRLGGFGHISQPNVFGKDGVFDTILDPNMRSNKVTDTQANYLSVVGNVYEHPNLFRKGLFAPINVPVPFKFKPLK